MKIIPIFASTGARGDRHPRGRLPLYGPGWLMLFEAFVTDQRKSSAWGAESSSGSTETVQVDGGMAIYKMRALSLAQPVKITQIAKA